MPKWQLIAKKAIHCTGKLLNTEVEAVDKNRHVDY